ncbi:MAG: hypothetical protein Q7V40_13620 [Pseudolabrys sp.]|nr:hypothetical protein [Pseudolabrys sp.]
MLDVAQIDLHTVHVLFLLEAGFCVEANGFVAAIKADDKATFPLGFFDGGFHEAHSDALLLEAFSNRHVFDVCKACAVQDEFLFDQQRCGADDFAAEFSDENPVDRVVANLVENNHSVLLVESRFEQV